MADASEWDEFAANFHCLKESMDAHHTTFSKGLDRLESSVAVLARSVDALSAAMDRVLPPASITGTNCATMLPMHAEFLPDACVAELQNNSIEDDRSRRFFNATASACGYAVNDTVLDVKMQGSTAVTDDTAFVTNLSSILKVKVETGDLNMIQASIDLDFEPSELYALCATDQDVDEIASESVTTNDVITVNDDDALFSGPVEKTSVSAYISRFHRDIAFAERYCTFKLSSDIDMFLIPTEFRLDDLKMEVFCTLHSGPSDAYTLSFQFNSYAYSIIFELWQRNERKSVCSFTYDKQFYSSLLIDEIILIFDPGIQRPLLWRLTIHAMLIKYTHHVSKCEDLSFSFDPQKIEIPLGRNKTIIWRQIYLCIVFVFITREYDTYLELQLCFTPVQKNYLLEVVAIARLKWNIVIICEYCDGPIIEGVFCSSIHPYMAKREVGVTVEDQINQKLNANISCSTSTLEENYVSGKMTQFHNILQERCEKVKLEPTLLDVGLCDATSNMHYAVKGIAMMTVGPTQACSYSNAYFNHPFFIMHDLILGSLIGEAKVIIVFDLGGSLDSIVGDIPQLLMRNMLTSFGCIRSFQAKRRKVIFPFDPGDTILHDHLNKGMQLLECCTFSSTTATATRFWAALYLLLVGVVQFSSAASLRKFKPQLRCGLKSDGLQNMTTSGSSLLLVQ